MNKGIILTAGKGERLKDITHEIPKPMILYKGKPILQYNVELCKKYDIRDLYFNLHHLPEKIKSYFDDGKKLDVNIQYSFEEELLGTSGAVKKIANELWTNEKQLSTSPPFTNSHNLKFLQSFYVIYGDNFSDFDLDSLRIKAEETKSMVVIAFHYREDVSHSGVAEFDENFRITKFIEKPKEGETQSHWVNAGIYFLSVDILNYIPVGISDFAKDIFPKLLEMNIPIFGVCSDTIVKAFDTLEMLNNSMKN